MSDLIIYSDSEKFETDVLKSDIPVAVDFYSEECPPCAQLAPIFDRMAEKYSHKMRFVKILRQANRPLAENYNVKSSPTIIFFENGKILEKRLSGYIKKPELRIAIEEIIGAAQLKVEKDKYNSDVLILGGGPAGLSAAIYTSRAKLNTIVLDEGIPGGQAATTFHIANYPGTHGVVEGKALMANMLEQAQSFGTQIHDLKEIFEVNLSGKEKTVITEDAVYSAKVVIIASGAEPRKLPAQGEETFRGRGVHYCATCDGAMYQDANVVVIGGGNSAVEEAVFLTRFAEKVTILHEFDYLQASKTAQQEARANSKIDFVWNVHIKEVLGENHVSGVKVKNIKDGSEQDIPSNGIFVYIGTQPRTALFQKQLDVNEWGYIKTDEEMRTNIPGILAAGDVRVKSVRQVITAAGDGCVAAITAEKYLAELQRD